MENLFCADYVKFNCSQIANNQLLNDVSNRISEYLPNLSDEELNARVDFAANQCFANSEACQLFSNGNKFPSRTGTGAITTAILVHQLGK